MVRNAILIVALVAAFVPYQGFSQVLINEACSKNASILSDADGNDPDWIELFNSGDTDENLEGCSLSDNSGETWHFPSATIKSGEFLLIFASGNNRTAPELHASFKLSDEGDALVLRDAGGNIIDTVEFGYLAPDHSFGRSHDGLWKVFPLPTPGSSNQSSAGYSGYAPDPTFSKEAGFYAESATLTLLFDTSSTVHYTTDGSIPTLSSAAYTSPIIIDSTRVIRACAFSKSGDFLPSRVITRTYFIGFTSTLPVFSLSTDPYNLWDWNHGIYVKGPNASPDYPYYGANYWQDWEVPVNVEFFETNKKQVINQEAGLSINGGSVSRTRPMQSLRLTARDNYGHSTFDYRMFEEKKIHKFKIFVLRNSSGDYNKTHFRDGSLHKLMLNHVDVDLLCYRPSVVFLNGTYWGIQNIREKFSKFYMEENHHADPDNLDLLEEDSTIVQGDFTEFNRMYQYITSSDLRNSAVYDSVAKMLDIYSFCDYIIAETFLSNIDWPYNNIKYWKERSPGHTWRYLLMDLDISLGNYGWAPASMDVLGRMLGPYGDLNRHVQILRSLLKNPDFRDYFINRYADLVNTLFTTEHMKAHIENVKETLEPEMPRHFARWGNSMDTWNFEIDSVVMPYIEQRPGYARQYIQDLFGLKKQTDLYLYCQPPLAGKIRINTITPDLPWSGTYFDGVPVTLTVIPEPGFTFKRWISSNISLADPSSFTVTFNPDTNSVITAYFGPEEEDDELGIFPNPATGAISVYFLSNSEQEGSLSICDLTGKTVMKKEHIMLTEGVNNFFLSVTNLPAGVYILSVRTLQQLKKVKMMIIH